MNAPQATHSTPEQLSAYALGKLNDADTAAVHEHLEGCDNCRRLASSIPPDSFVGLVRSAHSQVSVSASTPLPAVTQGLPAIKSAPASAAVDALPELPPELAGHAKFHILRELGRGGMGVVYQAEHCLMKRPVAIKVLSRRLLDHPESLARFHQEVETAAQLDHANIVRAFDAEQAGTLHLLVMEYVEGQSLAQLLERQGPVPIVQACQLAGQTAQGLQHAFEKNTIHRDIKPHNLMLTLQGVVKILDFGLARLAERPRAKGLTADSVVMGTPEYLAPEQATDARQADIRSDIYSLGCTLYHLLSGQPPFQGETAMQTILSHLEKESPSLQQLRPEVPAALTAVVAKMMAKKPADRYQTPAEVLAALAPFCQPGPHSAEATKAKRWPASRSKRGRVAALLAIAVLSVAAWLLGGVIFKTRVTTADGDAFMVLEIDQAGAEVQVDGQTLTVNVPGDSKPVQIKIEPGQHRLRIRKDGFVAVTREIELKTGRAQPIKVRLEPVQGARPPAKTGSAPADRKPSTVVGGDWRVEGQELVQTDTKAPAYLFFGDKSWTDYDVSLETKTVSGTEGCKVFFRATDPAHYYAFAVGSYGGTWDETFRIEKGKWIRDLPPLQQKYRRDRWNAVRIQVRLEQIRCFLDGKKLFEYSDAHFPKGQIGLSSWSTSVRWKKIKVSAPDGKVLWEGPPDLVVRADR